MKITLISNFINHHQLSFCQALSKTDSVDFHFVATSKTPGERIKLGYTDEQGDFIIPAYKSSQEYERAWMNCASSDVVIFGSAPQKYISESKAALKFYYSERIYKNISNPIKTLARFAKYSLKNIYFKDAYLLCASAYAPGDYAKSAAFRNRCYKWGYFPETKHYDISELFEKKRSDIPYLLWVGRYLPLKHPDDVILVAQRLKDEGYAFKLDFIGTGVMEAQLAEMIREKGLEDCVQLLGSMKPEQVREHMERANIYMFTSDRGEGWGAVLNESMNSGCAVVASHAIGSVPFLMKDGENGLIYESGNVDMLYEKVKQLLDNPGEQRRLGEAAYHTIADLWNAEVAANRFVELSECILSGDKHPDWYEDGPCSKAEIIKERWFCP